MRKIFVRRCLLIVLVTVLLAVLANSLIQTYFAQRDAIKEGKATITTIAERIENNNLAIENLTKSLEENYLTRAWAFTEIIAQDPDIVFDRGEMDRMAQLLNVEEVHVTDELGVLQWGNVPIYYGLDFASTDQTRPFMPGLTDKSFGLAQAPQPNGSIGKLIQYVSVARQDKPGIVQVGVAPEVLDEALANNKIDVVMSNFNVSQGKAVLAIDRDTGIVAGDTHGMYVGIDYRQLGIPEECFQLKKQGDWIDLAGTSNYAVFGSYDHYIIGVMFTKQTMLAAQLGQNIAAVLSSTAMGLIIIVAIFMQLKKVVINDIEAINSTLKHITHGDLSVVVQAKATPEAVQLSDGINEMVDSLKDQITEIEAQSAQLEERNENILASLSYARRIQNNLLPNRDTFELAFQDYGVLWEPKDVVGGDIYWLKSFGDVTVLCVCDCTGHGTPGALLTMLVVTALESVVSPRNCDDPAAIMWRVNQKLLDTLNNAQSLSDIKDGADMAVLCIHKSGAISMASAKTHLFICDGQTVEQIKGQKLSLGSGLIADQGSIETVKIPANPRNRYYLASDGLYDQIGYETGLPFGYRRFKDIVLQSYDLPQREITQAVWAEFQRYTGAEERRDDITLLSFCLPTKEEG